MLLDIATQERVYRAIKNDFLAGAFTPGVRIEIPAIADRHGSSVTPVREALYRLTGEGLVEVNPDGGFRLALPDFANLASLYAWSGHQLLSALHFTSRSAIRSAMATIRMLEIAREPLPTALAANATFEAIARASGNDEYLASVQRTNHRLHYCRLAEAKLFGDLDRELRTFVRNGTIDVKTNARRRVIAYHRRRVEHAAQLHALIQQPWITP